MNVLEIQQALHAKGYDPGRHDGIRGRRTIDAIEAFQAAKGLVVDGIVGPMTAELLFNRMEPVGRPAVSVQLPWLAEARNLIGTKEFEGQRSNEEILRWAEDLNIPYGDDEIPWCGLFVAHCIGSQLPHEPLPTSPLVAKAWRTFGHPVAPQPGAVMVFWRERKDGPKGHVGFYVGEDGGENGHYHILAGNQSDKVCIMKVPKDKLLRDGARWPATVPPPNGRPNLVDGKGGELFNDRG